MSPTHPAAVARICHDPSPKPKQLSAAALSAFLALSGRGGGEAEPPPAPAPSGSTLVTFDETTPPTVVEFGGAGYAIEFGPAGGSSKVLRITRPGGDV